MHSINVKNYIYYRMFIVSLFLSLSVKITQILASRYDNFLTLTFDTFFWMSCLEVMFIDI